MNRRVVRLAHANGGGVVAPAWSRPAARRRRFRGAKTPLSAYGWAALALLTAVVFLVLWLGWGAH